MQSPSQQTWNRNGELQTKLVFFKEEVTKIEVLCKRGLKLEISKVKTLVIFVAIIKLGNTQNGWLAVIE